MDLMLLSSGIRVFEFSLCLCLSVSVCLSICLCVSFFLCLCLSVCLFSLPPQSPLSHSSRPYTLLLPVRDFPLLHSKQMLVGSFLNCEHVCLDFCTFLLSQEYVTGSHRSHVTDLRRLRLRKGCDYFVCICSFVSF